MDFLNLNLSKNKWIYVSISLLITILLFSCDHSNQRSDKPNSKRNISKTSEYFSKTIGNFKDGEINLSMSKQDLLALYQEYNTKYNLQRKGVEFEIITDSEDHLLVFYKCYYL